MQKSHDRSIERCRDAVECGQADPSQLLDLLVRLMEKGEYEPAVLQRTQVVRCLPKRASSRIDTDLLRRFFEGVLSFPGPETIDFAKDCVPFFENVDRYLALLMAVTGKLARRGQHTRHSVALAEIGLDLGDPFFVIRFLAKICSDNADFAGSIAWTRKLCGRSPVETLVACHELLCALLESGDWPAAGIVQREYVRLIEAFDEQSLDLDQREAGLAISTTYALPYLRDEARANRLIQNQVAERCEAAWKKADQEIPRDFQRRRRPGAPRIGYLGSGLRQHSVGWLTRWLFRYHDRERFEIAAYFLDGKKDWASEKWFARRSTFSRTLSRNPAIAAEEIRQDEIDVLVDLDSATLDLTCAILALKPAPLQVTWLGWDASGLSAVDYFLADPHVLPEQAEHYYRETIWRLPETFIAVDGFEAGTPGLRRQDLGIPADAVVFLSVQTGMKWHPEFARLQMRIVERVPGSCFLVKSLADEGALRGFLCSLAREEGVDPRRIRFLPRAPSELTHRADLQIADVVFDSYPYNGATTTLETLWAGIPVVTRVGEQFSARNSYSFMKNTGISEGIAHTDEEFVAWGVRLGRDETLRWEISRKLRRSRRTSPLWNARRFTREMERAYLAMIERSGAGC